MTTKKKYRNKKNTTKKCVVYTPFEKKITQQLNNKGDKVFERNKFKILDNLKIIINQDSKISPQNDFYTYINDRWIKNEDLYNINLLKNQKYIAQVDDFRLVQDTVYSQLNDIILNYIKKDNKTSKCMKNFYESNKNPDSNLVFFIFLLSYLFIFFCGDSAFCWFFCKIFYFKRFSATTVFFNFSPAYHCNSDWNLYVFTVFKNLFV
jgi:hypothetical protein